MKSCLAFYWNSLLMLLWLFMVWEIAHFGCNGATVCILINRQLSALMRKSSPIHSCTYDQNHITSLSTSSSLLSHRYRGAPDARITYQIMMQWSKSQWYTMSNSPGVKRNLIYSCMLVISLLRVNEYILAINFFMSFAKKTLLVRRQIIHNKWQFGNK